MRLNLGKRSLPVWQAVGALLGVGMLGAVVFSQLRRPRAQRTWQGRLGGVVPYDLRRPTVERLRRSVWDPEDPRILTDKSFGVGWNVNVASLARVRRPRFGSRTVDPASANDMRAVMEETLATNPMANYSDVLAAWHVRRGTAIDRSEADRLAEIYQEVFGPDRSITEREQLPDSVSFGAA
jgi:hypothetical protein